MAPFFGKLYMSFFLIIAALFKVSTWASASRYSPGSDLCVMHAASEKPAYRQNHVLLHRETPQDVVLVPAMWLHVYPGAPWHTQFNTCVYQRRNSSVPSYCRNLGYEGGIYFRYIVDHYYNLPNITVFIQEDAEEYVITRIDFLRRNKDWGWAPIAGDFIRGRTFMETWGGRKTERAIQKCWIHLLKAIGYPLPEEAYSVAWNPTINMYCCNYFAMTKSQILRHPLSFYENIYHRIVTADKCHYGEPNFDLNNTGGVDPDNWEDHREFSKYIVVLFIICYYYLYSYCAKYFSHAISNVSYRR